MPIPPFNPSKGTYSMAKEELIAWMYKYGWKYGDDKIVQHYIDKGKGQYQGQLTVQELIYIPKAFNCPNIKHKDSSWVFLKLMPTGVVLTCIHPRCRITVKLGRDSATKKKRSVPITYDEAKYIEKREHQFLLARKLQEHAIENGLFDEEF